MGDPSPSRYTNSYVLRTKWSRKSKYRMSEAGLDLERFWARARLEKTYG